MNPGLGRLRNRAVNAFLGVDLRGLLLGFQQSLQRIEALETQALAQRGTQMEFITRRLSAQIQLLKKDRDRIPELTAALASIRRNPDYEAAYATEEPLISVRIAAYQKTKELLDVAVASVLAQTYQNFEIIVVNDGPNARTREALAKLQDPRIRYEEFERRSSYPQDDHSRWMVAGSPGMNRAADLASGLWIAPLDEDDSFTPDHLEKLLGVALSHSAELAYGAVVQRNLVNNTESLIWSDPPAISQFSFQGAMYLRMLHPHFRYDEESWLVDEPGDWNLARRMSAAGVRTAAIRDVVAEMNHIPYTHKAVE